MYLKNSAIAASLAMAILCFPSQTQGAASNRPATHAEASSDGLWREVDESGIVRRQARQIVPQAYRSLALDTTSLRSRLAKAPMEDMRGARASELEMTLPMPDGSFARFSIVESPIMAPELAAKFPEIKTYLGQGIDDPSATLRFDVTPRGFHGQILSAKGTSYIDPYQPGDNDHYIAYAKRDLRRSGAPMKCLVTGEDAPEGLLESADPFLAEVKSAVASDTSTPSAISSGTTLRTYRLAVAATGEYTATYGGTVSGGLSGIVTTMNRVNGIYEREVSVRMVLVANNNLIIYTSAATDPYLNSSGDLTNNQNNINAVIGSANYDIGHLVTTGGGGVAALGSPCGASKAKGLTGLPAPVGDAYDIDFVAHEMGHQFGGNHTFNGSVGNCSAGNRNPSTSYEPGSGFTIQAYAGICAEDDLQPHSEDYFHRVSLDEILAFTTTGTGTCSVNTASGNTPPTVTAPADVTIPAQTPFALTAVGSDANGDTLTYLWEEFDIGPSASCGDNCIQGPFAGGVLTDNGASAIFRSYAPVNSPTREFPSLRYQLANANTPPATSPEPGTTTPAYMTGEVLPTTTRAMKFRVTVRDNRAGGGGTNDDEMFVNTVSTAGPFVITAPNTATTWAAGSAQTVTWNVASTDLAPISVANVRIVLSTDGGNSYPVELAASVPNNGSANITVPANTLASLQARVRVEAIGNIFFDISNTNFTITSANTAPTITVTGSVTTRQGSPAAVANVATVADTNGNPVSVSLAGVPPELTASVINSSGTVQLTAAAACSLVTPSSGNKVYPLTLLATDSQGGTASASVNVNVGSNLIPTLGTYANKLTFPSTSSSVTPSVVPTDGSGNLTGVSVSPTSLPGGGTVSIDPVTGIVSISTTAGTTLGAYPISITASDSCGAVRIVTFTLTVGTPDPLLSLASSTITSGNALIEPNECNTLNLTVTNGGGSTATTVSSTLSSTTPGVTIAQPASAYPNIAVSTQATNTTAYQISSASSMQCGTNVALTQTVTYAGNGSPAVFNFTLPVGQVASNNYLFASGTGASVPAGGVLLASSNADDLVLNLAVPADFNFSVYNTAVAGGSTLRVSTNGNLQVAGSGGSAVYNNAALPATGSLLGNTFPASAPIVFPYWTDLRLNITNGGIYTQLAGTAPNRQWILEWRGRVDGDGATAINTIIALVLTEGTNKLEYRYLQTGTGSTANAGDATIGVQAASTGTIFTQYSLNTASISAGTVLTGTLPVTICTTGPGVCGFIPPPSLSIADASVAEGNAGARALTFTVTLSSAAPAGGVSFDIATTSARSTGNTALAGNDYAATSLTGVTIAAGQTNKTFTVKVYGDTRVEADELFNVAVSNVTGATVTKATALGTIVNDDAASVLSVANDAAASPATLSIAAIQGDGLVSAFAGRSVVVRGIVTALTSEGFFLQSPDGGHDTDKASSEGLYVFTGEVREINARIGNLVAVHGQVQEATSGAGRHALSLTRIAAADVVLVSSGQTLPAPVVLDAGELRANRSATWLERYEGMRVSVPGLTVVAPSGGRIDDASATAVADGNFYGVASGTARPFREPGLHVLEPAPLRAAANAPVFDGNPERLQVDSLGQTGGTALAVDVGDRVSGLIGVLSHGQGAYALLPDPQVRIAVIAAAVPRAVTAPSASEITIGHFNARRFFDDVDDPKASEPVLTANAYALRLAKTANAVCAYTRSPDILGVAEVENLSTLSDLAEAINGKAGNVLFPEACTGNTGYQAHFAAKGNGNLGVLVNAGNVRPGVPRVQVLSLQPLGRAISFKHPDGSSEALFEQSPLLMRARINKASGGAELLTVVINQLRSADGLDDDSPGHHGWASQAGYVRAKRLAQAQQLAQWLQHRQAGNSREQLVVLGGFESNEFGDGQDDLMGLLTGQRASQDGLPNATNSPVNPPLINLTLRMPQAERYSISREGNAEAVDHVLVNQAMLDGRYRLRTEFARINADFGEDNAGDFSVPLRVSDHDAVILYLGEP